MHVLWFLINLNTCNALFSLYLQVLYFIAHAFFLNAICVFLYSYEDHPESKKEEKKEEEKTKKDK